MRSSCVLLALMGCVSATPRMQVANNRIVDEHGRVRIFHGFNDIGHAKSGDYLPKATRSQAVLETMRRAGLNTARMPLMWSGLAPKKGEFNSTYVSTLKSIVSNMAEMGFHPFMDSHQDLFSTIWADGAPAWVVNETKPRHAFPWPFKKQPNSWGERYLTEEIGQCFGELYHNTHGTGDAFADAWTQAAKEFLGVPGVLGFELLNEPWAGDVFEDPLLLDPIIAARKSLEPFYKKLVDRIRAVDNQTIIFYEPVTWGVYLPGVEGFSGAVGGEGQSVFSWHYYCWILEGKHNASGSYPIWEKVVCDDVLEPLPFRHVDEGIKKMGQGVSSFLTEWGSAAVPSISKPSDEGSREAESVMRNADKYFQSWTYWDISSIVNRPSCTSFQMDHFLPFARPYAAATAGAPVAMEFVPSSKVFTLTYQPAAGASGLAATTEIMVPEYVYPSNGYDVAVSAAGWTVTHSACNAHFAQVLCLVHSGKATGAVTVTVTPKK